MFNRVVFNTLNQVDVGFDHLLYLLDIELSTSFMSVEMTCLEAFLVHTVVEKFLIYPSIPKDYEASLDSASQKLRDELKSQEHIPYPLSDIHCNYVRSLLWTANQLTLIESEENRI